MVLITLLLACASDPVDSASEPDAAARRRVLIVGWDGVRGDVARAVATPHLDRLAARGGVDYRATTQRTGPTKSAPGWTSVLTGVEADQHGVMANGEYGDRDGSWTTLIHDAAEAGLTTHVGVVWPEVVTDIIGAGIATDTWLSAEDELADWLVDHLERDPGDVSFLHHDAPDHAGHATGFTLDNPDYVDAVEASDARLGRYLDVIEARTVDGSEAWLVMVTTDHGGSGTDHGPLDADNQTIFLAGGVYGAEASWSAEGSSHLDLVPTAMAFLGLEGDARGYAGRDRLR